MQAGAMFNRDETGAAAERGYLFVRVPTEVLEALDAFAHEAPGKPSRAQAIEHVLRDWLIEHGYMSRTEA